MYFYMKSTIVLKNYLYIISFQIVSSRFFDICLSGPRSADDVSLVKLLKEKFLDWPSKLPYNLSTDAKYLLEMQHSSMQTIKALLLLLLDDRKGGFFVEAGALDGQYVSNTLWLEKDLNWTGLLIEPDPYNFKELKSKQRKAWISNSCISVTPYPKKVVFKSLKRPSSTEALNWVYRGNSHIKDIPLGWQIENTSEITYRKVQCFPLHTYLLALNRTHIDFLSLDTQGGEADILRRFPWNKITVEIVIIEHIDMEGLIDKEIIKFMNANNFILFALTAEPDYLFLNKHSDLYKSYKHETVQSVLDKDNALYDNQEYYAGDMLQMEFIKGNKAVRIY